MKNFLAIKKVSILILIVALVVVGFYLFKKSTEIKDDSPYVQYEFMERGEMVYQRLYEYFPEGMADFLDSYRNCQHWGGEEAYNEERANDISQGVASSCIDFELEEKAIEKKYTNDPKLREMKVTKEEIDSGESMNYSFVWNDPKKESKVLNKYTEAEAQWILKTVQEQMQEFDVALKNKADSQKMADIRFRLGVQKSYLNSLIPEIDRLHPITRKEIEALRNNKEFFQRASDI